MRDVLVANRKVGGYGTLLEAYSVLGIPSSIQQAFRIYWRAAAVPVCNSTRGCASNPMTHVRQNCYSPMVSDHFKLTL